MKFYHNLKNILFNEDIFDREQKQNQNSLILLKS